MRLWGTQTWHTRRESVCLSWTGMLLLVATSVLTLRRALISLTDRTSGDEKRMLLQRQTCEGACVHGVLQLVCLRCDAVAVTCVALLCLDLWELGAICVILYGIELKWTTSVFKCTIWGVLSQGSCQASCWVFTALPQQLRAAAPPT